MTYLAIAVMMRSAPPSWTWIPLRRVASLRRMPNRNGDAQLLALSSERGIEARPEDGGRQLPSEATIFDYWLVEPEDLVFNPMWAVGGGVGVSRVSGAVSPAYRTYRLLPTIVPRFLDYYLRSTPVLAQYRLVVRGLTTFDRSVTREDFEGMPIPLPPLVAQQAIVDYLDRETARSDALVQKKQLLLDRLGERLEAVRDGWVRDQFEKAGSSPFRRLLARVEQGWSPECDGAEADPAEWGVLRTSSVSSGVFRPSENKRLPASITPDLRWVVRDGDLLLVRGSGSPGSVGQSAVARTEGRMLLLSDLLYRLVCPSTNPQFLAAVLTAPTVRGLIEGSIRTDSGQTLKLRGDDIRQLPIPRTPPEEQAHAVLQLDAACRPVIASIERIQMQMRLLSEYRASVITAAVTGELGISRVAA